jgi:hypothetical protein
MRDGSGRPVPVPAFDPMRTLLLDNLSDCFTASIANDALILRQESLARCRSGGKMNCIRIRSALLATIAWAALASPASATHWTATNDPWFWVDLDDVEVKDGLTYYAVDHSSSPGIPPEVATLGSARYFSNAINCATREMWTRSIANSDAYFDDDTGTVVPQYRWDKPQAKDYDVKIFMGLCNR